MVRALVKLREYLAAHGELARKLPELERKVGCHDEAIRSLVATIRELMQPPAPPKRRPVGFHAAKERAITHVAPLKSIEPWKDTGKYVVNFSQPAAPIGPIRFVKDGRVKALQNLRYTNRARLEGAKTLDDIW